MSGNLDADAIRKMIPFFVLRPPNGDRFGLTYAYVTPLRPYKTNLPPGNKECPVCSRPYGMLEWTAPRRAKLSSARFGDFLWGSSVELAYSHRLISQIRKRGLACVEVAEEPLEIIQIKSKRGQHVGSEPPPEYWLARIEEDGANLNDVDSGAVRQSVKCAYCRQSIDAFSRVVLEEGSWSGCDIFYARGLPGTILVSERFKDMVEEEHFTNCELIPAGEHSFDLAARIDELDRLAEQMDRW